MESLGRLIYIIFAIATAMIAQQIHHDVIISILCFLFAPIAWIVWLINHSVNLTIIQTTFSFFFK